MSLITKIIHKLSKYFCWLEEAFLCFLLLAMIVLACMQILLRDIFSTGFMWTDPLLRIMVIWAGLFGAAVATRKEKHISLDLASYLVPGWARPGLNFLTSVFSVIVCAFLTYAAITFVKNEAAFSSGGNLLGISSWIINLVFPAAFALIALRFLIIAAGNILEITRHLFGRTSVSS